MKLDGADTALAHIVRDGHDAGEGRLARRGRLGDDERIGTIRDIARFRLVG